MVAEFRGAPPHDLGTAELAMARGVDNNIEVTLHLLDDWHRPTDQIVRVRMAPATARTLADRLWAVAETMDIQKLGALERRCKFAGTSDAFVHLVLLHAGHAGPAPRYRFAQTIVTRRVVELGLAPQRAPFVRGTSG